MRIVFAVFLLTIAYVASYPSFGDAATENEDNDLELELRSILNQLDEERMERSLTSDEESDDEYEMSKRQGGLNVIDKQSKCEIQCIGTQRNPAVGKGKTVKEAAKICKNQCVVPNKKRTQKKKTILPGKQQSKNKLSLREFSDDESSDSEEQQQQQQQQLQRREFYDYLMEQLQQNNDE